jgi:hypothetical protein
MALWCGCICSLGQDGFARRSREKQRCSTRIESSKCTLAVWAASPNCVSRCRVFLQRAKVPPSTNAPCGVGCVLGHGRDDEARRPPFPSSRVVTRDKSVIGLETQRVPGFLAGAYLVWKKPGNVRPWLATALRQFPCNCYGLGLWGSPMCGFSLHLFVDRYQSPRAGLPTVGGLDMSLSGDRQAFRQRGVRENP